MKRAKKKKVKSARWTAIDAADYAFDRFNEEVRVDSVVQELTLGARTIVRPVESPDVLKIRTAIARLVDVHAGLLSRVVYTLADELTDSITTRASAPAAAESVLLVGEPGATAGAILWIHNVSGAYAPGLTLRLTDLHHPNGSVVRGGLGTIDPDRLDGSIDARRSAWVSVAIPAAADRGTYHGHVLADGVDGAAVQVGLTVR